jgi:hypothetical protein
MNATFSTALYGYRHFGYKRKKSAKKQWTQEEGFLLSTSSGKVHHVTHYVRPRPVVWQQGRPN